MSAPLVYYRYSENERFYIMMQFKIEDGAFFATNSIKPVSITKFDDDCYVLFMSKGDEMLDYPIHMQFVTFDEAKRWAEHKVGVQVEFA